MNELAWELRHLNCSFQVKKVTLDVSAQVRPFRISFKTDADEIATNDGINQNKNNEQNGAPGGITGFRLSYVQNDC